MSRAVEILNKLNEVRTVKRRVVRAGKVVTIKKRLFTNTCGKGRKHDRNGRCVAMSSKEKMALKRLQTSGAKRRRMRSMAIHRTRIHQSMGEELCCNAAIVFDPEVYGDDLSDIIDQVHDALKDQDVDYSMDDPDTLPIEIVTEDFDAVAEALAPFEGVTLVEMEDDEEPSEGDMESEGDELPPDVE